MSQHNKIAYIYNPANQTYEELVQNFVIRKKEFKKIFNEIVDVDLNCSAQHFLIEGQRGTGKTSLLLRLKYEIENSDNLNNLIAIQFAEESYNIFDLCRIWESCAEILEDTDGFETISDELESMSDEDDYTKECFYIFEKYLIKNNKRLVLLLDNFGDILDKLSDIEQKRLRDIFHNSTYIQLITSSSRALEHTYRHDKPFFEFFEIVKLSGLNKEETNIFLKQLSLTSNNNINKIIEEQPQRIETIRRLTGGIPRTIVLLFEIFLDNSANVFEDLEIILDRVTPLYKHRMDDLPTKQQAIMDTIALNWDGITTKEIVEKLKKRGFDTKSVSSQLKGLEKNDLVLSKNIDKKNKLYMIKERFFNIWYLMRLGRKKNKLQVQWLVRFLEEWCKSNKTIGIGKDNNSKFLLSKKFLIDDKYQESVDIIKELIISRKYINTVNEMIDYFIFLMAKKQYHLTYNLFKEFPDLKIQFKPIYYTMLYFLKDEYPKEYLKMGEELEQTVEEILVEIEQKAQKYN